MEPCHDCESSVSALTRPKAGRLEDGCLGWLVREGRDLLNNEQNHIQQRSSDLMPLIEAYDRRRSTLFGLMKSEKVVSSGADTKKA